MVALGQRLGWHLPPGEKGRRKGLHVLRAANTDPLGAPRTSAPGKVGRAPGPLPAPSPPAGPSETETQKKKCAQACCPGAGAHRPGAVAPPRWSRPQGDLRTQASQS